MKLKNYKSKTPITVELVSDCLLIFSTTITSYAVFEGNSLMAWISLGTGLVGKILARFVNESSNK